MHEILTVSIKEFRDGMRNMWVFAITVIFALFALGLAYFGSAASGQVGFTSLDTTIVSLASLAIFVIPLIALMLAYDSIVGEEELGTLLLLLSYPITRFQILAGKFIGHAALLAMSTVMGFGLAGIAIAALTGQLMSMELWRALGFFIASATLLGWVFIAFAYLVSVFASEKSRAAGLALIIWFFFVLVFDLLLLGILVGSHGAISAQVFPFLLLLNPADVFRLANLAGFEAAQAYSGLVSVATAHLFRPWLLLVVLGMWTVIPFSVAALLFQRRTP